MIKKVYDRVLSFDIEWAPDVAAGQLLHGTVQDSPAAEWDAYQALWRAGGATEENPQPYLKTCLCRIVSIAGIFREYNPDGNHTSLRLISMPADPDDLDKWTEAHLIETFLKAIGQKKPQLVAYNSGNADLPILVQRAVQLGLHCPEFCERPDKPWEGADYFSTYSEHHVDLAKLLGAGRNTPSLHEMATLSGIPGKLDMSGDGVARLWGLGKRKQIVDYNEFDAFTTHLLWARVAHFSGHFTTEQYLHEQKLVRELIEEEIGRGKGHLQRFLDKWDELSAFFARRK